MANSNRPRGFQPVRHNGGGCIRLNSYSIASTYNTNIFSGDVVELTGTGKNISKAAAANADNLGVFAGCRFVDAFGDPQWSPYWPADQVATQIEAYVFDDPAIVYECQIDTVAEADVGNLCDIHVGTGSAATGQSGAYADESTKGTADASLRIIGLSPRPDNAYGAYAKIEVMLAEAVPARVVAGVGGV